MEAMVAAIGAALVAGATVAVRVAAERLTGARKAAMPEGLAA